LSDEKRPRSTFNELADALGNSDSEALTRASSGQAVFFGSVGEEFRRAMEGTATAAAALRESVDRIPDFTYSPPSYQEPLFDPGELIENPAHETNKLLNELSFSIKALVDVAKKEADLTDAINKSTETALGYAINSSKDAATATKLVRFSIWIAIFSVFIGTAVTLYLDNRNNAVANSHFAEEQAVRQQEVRTLNEISAQLAAEAKARSQTAVSKAPKKK
jgi:hypothetical protein